MLEEENKMEDESPRRVYFDINQDEEEMNWHEGFDYNIGSPSERCFFENDSFLHDTFEKRSIKDEPQVVQDRLFKFQFSFDFYLGYNLLPPAHDRKEIRFQPTRPTQRRNPLSSRINSPGLRAWAKACFGYIQKHQKATYEEIDEYLGLKFPNNQEKTNKNGKKEKNRKRRVYDAINVAISTGDLDKYKENKKFYIEKYTEVVGQVTSKMINRKKNELKKLEKKLCSLKQN